MAYSDGMCSTNFNLLVSLQSIDKIIDAQPRVHCIIPLIPLSC